LRCEYIKSNKGFFFLLAKVDCFAKSANQNVEIQQKSETCSKGSSMGGWSKGAQSGAEWKPRNTN
jgi:hypothetical protein